MCTVARMDSEHPWGGVQGSAVSVSISLFSVPFIISQTISRAVLEPSTALLPKDSWETMTLTSHLALLLFKHTVSFLWDECIESMAHAGGLCLPGRE